MSENKEFNFNFVHLIAILFLILVFAFICYLAYFPFEYIYYSRLSPAEKVDLKVKQTKEINDLLIIQVKLDTDFNKYKLNLNNHDYDSFKIVNFNNKYDYYQGLYKTSYSEISKKDVLKYIEEKNEIKIDSSKHYINLIFKDISLDNLIKLKTKFNIWIASKNSKYFGDDLFETIRVIEIPKKELN